MKYLREIIATMGSVIIIAIGLFVRSLNLPFNDLDLLIGAFYGVIPFLLWGGWSNRFKKLVGKPKLEFEAKIEEDSFKRKKNDKNESTRLTFWIFIRNAGNEVAENCKIRLKITDQSGKKLVVDKTTHPSIDEDIPISWRIAGEKQESRDISPSKYSDSMFKIPFIMEYYPDEDSKDFVGTPIGKWYFEEPVKKPHPLSIVTLVGENEIIMGFLFEAIIISNIGVIGQRKFKLDIDIGSVIFEAID